MRRLIACIALLGPVLAGCGEIRLVDDLPPAPLLEPYEAAITAERAKPPIQFDLFEGELPGGVVLGQDGTLSGTPVGVGTYEFQVRAVDDNDRWVVAALHLEVETVPEEVYVGPILTGDGLPGICVDGYTNGSGEVHTLMCQPWVRIQGAGMVGQDERALLPGVFWVGENGEAEGGWGDDLLLRELEPLAVSWSFEPSESWPEAVEAGPNSPADAAVDATGVFTAGEATGPGWVRVSDEQFGSGDIEVLVVPPDFCPAPQGC